MSNTVDPKCEVALGDCGASPSSSERALAPTGAFVPEAPSKLVDRASDVSKASPVAALEGVQGEPFDATELSTVLKAVAVVGLLATVAAVFLAGKSAAFSVGFGALLGFGNLFLLGRMVRVFLSRGGVSMPWVIAALLKLAVLFLAMYLPVRAGVLELLPFVFGFGALPVGIVASQFLSVPTNSKAN